MTAWSYSLAEFSCNIEQHQKICIENTYFELVSTGNADSNLMAACMEGKKNNIHFTAGINRL